MNFAANQDSALSLVLVVLLNEVEFKSYLSHQFACFFLRKAGINQNSISGFML